MSNTVKMKEHLEIVLKDQEDLPAAATTILDFAGNTRVFMFYAPMGAGKTSLIKELCATLGSKDSFSSPTYSIINEYHSPSGKLFHLDLYRIKSQEELFDLGMEEILGGDLYCFIEWPELAESMIDVNYLKIDIEVKDNIRYLRAFHF